VAKKKEAKKTRSKGNAIVNYLRDTRAELRKVHWPTRQEAWGLTKIVLGVTIAMTIFLGLILDNVFRWWLAGIIDRSAIAFGATAVVAVGCVVVAIVLRQRAA
jgi:preprotein translocase subunit SecE